MIESCDIILITSSSDIHLALGSSFWCFYPLICVVATRLLPKFPAFLHSMETHWRGIPEFLWQTIISEDKYDIFLLDFVTINEDLVTDIVPWLFECSDMVWKNVWIWKKRMDEKKKKTNWDKEEGAPKGIMIEEVCMH